MGKGDCIMCAAFNEGAAVAAKALTEGIEKIIKRRKGGR